MIGMIDMMGWDETSMTSRYVFKVEDKTFGNILKTVDPALEHVPFSGMPFVFEDFRQILPVISGGTRADIIDQYVNRSTLL